MFRKDLSKYLFISCCKFLWLTLFLAACQSGGIVKQDSEPLTNINTTETPTDLTLTVKVTSAPTPSPTLTAIPTLTPTSQESTTTLEADPTIVPTRTSFHGWLLFSSRRHDSNEDGIVDEKDGIHLYKLNVSTGHMTQLTFGNHQNLYPSWSPDGSQIAFVSNREGNFELYVMNMDGSEMRKLTHSLEDEITPKWSPDGTRIVYVLVTTLDSGLQEMRLYFVSPLGENLQQITNGLGNDYAPDWSPDGRYLTFSRSEDRLESDGIIYQDINVYLWDWEQNQFFNLTLSNQESGQIRFDDAHWLPRDGYFLSMIQTPGDLSSADIKVFELEWENGQPALYRIFAIADAYGPYAWGPNGEWLISIFSNSQHVGTVSDEAVNDLVLLPVDFSTQRRALTANITSRSSINYSLIDGELITNDAFFDNYPDWTP